MSEQRKMRAELRQGLHQFLMQLFFSYSQTLDKQAATEQIAEVLKEQYEYFTGIGMPTQSDSEIKELASKLEKQASATTDFELQMRYLEDMETLLKAHEILTKERGR